MKPCNAMRYHAPESSSVHAMPCFIIDTEPLTHWGRDKMDTISQTILSNAFSWMKIFEFRLKFHWSLFLRVQLTIFQHLFRYWFGAVQATSHYLNQWWSSQLTHICVTRLQWVNNQSLISWTENVTVMASQNIGNCLFNGSFIPTLNKTSKFPITGLFWGKLTSHQ